MPLSCLIWLHWFQIVEMLKRSLLVVSTPPPLKVARLYLLSDILHNSGSSVKNASTYRSAIA